MMRFVSSATAIIISEDGLTWVTYLCWVGQNCHLLEVADSFGSLAAQKRNESRMHTGFSFLDCKVDGTGIQIFLGRAWGNFSRTVYAYTYMNDIIYSGGWSDFGFPQRDQ